MKRIKNLIIIIFLAGISLILILNTASSQETAGQLFEKALYLEEGKGDLKAALAIYEEIATDNSVNRSLRAKARLHTGICWEKMGREEAQRAYKQVIQEFTDQQEVVSEARSRLSKLDQPIRATEPIGMMVRKIWEGLDIDNCGEISPDGKYLSYVHWETGDLAIYEIVTGKKRLLTNKGSWEESDEFAQFSRWSPDSKHIVYEWFNENEFIEMRIIGLDGSEPRILFRDANVPWAQIYDLSPDGKNILAIFDNQDGSSQIVLVSTANSSVRVLKTLGKYPEMMSFSPDGRYIVYDFPQNDNSPERDISLLSTDGSQETRLIEHPANDFVMGWVPDGKQILYTSDRSGTPDIWAIEVLNGKAQGDPRLIMSMKGPRSPNGLGFKTDGSFYYSYFPNSTDVYVTEINPETGDIVVPPHEAINRFVGSNVTPAYSPDGKYLAYVSRRAPFERRWVTEGRTGNTLCIRSSESGKDREFRPGLKKFGFPRWSPDSRSVIVVNWENDDEHMGHYQIDTQTGEVKLIVKTGKPQSIFDHDWSADGKSVFLVNSEVIGDSVHIMKIVRQEIESGSETELLRGSWRDIYSISCSPDGDWLAVVGRDEKKRDLRIISTAGGEPRIVYTFEQGDNSNCRLTWSADSRYILLPKYRSPKKERKWDLYRIPVKEGEVQNLGLAVDDIWWPSAHPDGRHIAFFNRGSSYELPAVWVMENFISE
jgi:Tol biopolymer transport system component